MEAILDIIIKYVPDVLAVLLVVIASCLQKGQLTNAMELLRSKAKEMTEASKFKDINDNIQALIMTIEAQQQKIQELTDCVNKIKRPTNDTNNKEV